MSYFFLSKQVLNAQEIVSDAILDVYQNSRLE